MIHGLPLNPPPARFASVSDDVLHTALSIGAVVFLSYCVCKPAIGVPILAVVCWLAWRLCK